MHERCDGCGKQVPVLAVVFNGRLFLCPECAEHKSPTIMGLHARMGV